MWSVGLAVAAAVTVTLLWVFLGSGSAADASRLEAIRTASSIVIGAGGAAALLLAARRQRYVELDLEQKDHDASERRVTELYGKAADQLGSDKAPVRLAGVYALERLAQGSPEHRQTIVNVLCAYLRMPYDVSEGTAALQEREVRGAAQNVFEAHLRPADPDTFWPDIDLNLTGATLEWFWFRDCRARNAIFRGTTFHEIAAFRDSTFTARSSFRGARFLSTADLRRTAFGPKTTDFRDATFDGSITFGEEPTHQPRRLDLTGATAAVTPDAERSWPAGWQEEPASTEPPRVRLIAAAGE